MSDAALPGYEALLSLPGGEVVATARTRLTRRVEIGGRAFYLKTQEFLLRPRYFLRASAYVREARAYDRMAAAGIRVPEVASVGERRRFGLLRDALILTREVEGAIDLARWEEEGFAARDGLPTADEVKREVRETIDRAHAAGYRFGDLKPRNVLVAPPDDRGRSMVILDQRRFHRCPLGIHTRERDFRYLRLG